MKMRHSFVLTNSDPCRPPEQAAYKGCSSGHHGSFGGVLHRNLDLIMSRDLTAEPDNIVQPRAHP